MSRHIHNLIKQGEHQTLDFKHSITDSKKIARSLAAFANTDGGTLLIGVKDNGNVVGVNTDEEYYMVESAAQLYCKPEVRFNVAKWVINGKTILEVTIKPSKNKPHKAPDKDNQYKAYVRVADENMIATPIQLKIWRAERNRKSIRLNLTERESKLLEYLKENKRVTVNQFCRIGFLSRADAESILVNLTVLGLIVYTANLDEEYFQLVKIEA